MASSAAVDLQAAPGFFPFSADDCHSYCSYSPPPLSRTLTLVLALETV
jgi:hypothetical protein